MCPIRSPWSRIWSPNSIRADLTFSATERPAVLPAFLFVDYFRSIGSGNGCEVGAIGLRQATTSEPLQHAQWGALRKTVGRDGQMEGLFQHMPPSDRGMQ